MPRLLPGLLALVVLVGACAAPPDPRPSPSPTATPSPALTSEPTPGAGAVIPAPGSESGVYPPNPGAIVVAVEAGHGGCLDWGVPNPFDNTVEKAEKTMTLGIARQLRDLLEAEGLGVVMIRDDDVALAGDAYPDLGCHGAPFRDVDGDGHAGFGPSVPEATRTRDELSARIDAANLARADLYISIHINSMTQNGVVYEIAATETFYSDRTPWADDSRRLGELVQEAVVGALGTDGYQRQDRGVKAIDYYVIGPPPDEDHPLGPPRGLGMPGVLAEVGSMSLEAEGELLATTTGQSRVAGALFEAVAAFLTDRPLAVRYDALLPGGGAGLMPDPVPGTGPPFLAPPLPANEPLGVRITNTGTRAWPAGLTLVGAWVRSDDPYLAATPDGLVSLDVEVPALEPGAAVELEVPPLPLAGQGRHIAWLSLADSDGPLADRGHPALQLSVQHD